MGAGAFQGARTERTDVLVIGSGVAGLRCSLAASRHGRVLMICKDTLDASNTWYAQGGIAIPVDGKDDVATHIEDTIRVGCGLSDRTVVEFVIRRARHALDELLSWGALFDRNDGNLALGREGGHSRRRIVHAGGDATGKALSEVLTRRVLSTNTIDVGKRIFVTDLLMHEGRCVGATGLSESNELIRFLASRTVIAAGGAGELFENTTNPPGATADGMAIALRAGATLRDLEFVQFHPTALNTNSPRHPLLSEAVRGEGGRLVDRNGRSFMYAYHPMGDLAPRDIVSRAIVQEMARSGGEPVYVDVRHFPPGRFAQRFPGIDETCREFGIDPTRGLIPVCPAAHYAIGGIKVDMEGRSTLGGLYACGEAASTGMHGANRLASNSLLEALVLGETTGDSAGREAAADQYLPPIDQIQIPETQVRGDPEQIDATVREIRELMWRDCGVERHRDGLERAAAALAALCDRCGDARHCSRAGREAANLCVIARATVAAALRREETRGVHFRRDYPEADDLKWRRRIEFSPNRAGELTSAAVDQLQLKLNGSAFAGLGLPMRNM